MTTQMVLSVRHEGLTYITRNDVLPYPALTCTDMSLPDLPLPPAQTRPVLIYPVLSYPALSCTALP